ncbi:MAG: diadenylate cyclase CdaA [Bacteroidales bacterium]
MFFDIRFFDILDIILVATLFYQIYKLIRGTVAINIFLGIFFLYVLWIIVNALNMELLGAILGQVLGVGVLALFIVFQQEIRKFLLYIGTQYSHRKFSVSNFFLRKKATLANLVNIDAIVKASRNMSDSKTGALIVIERTNSLMAYAETGDMLNATTSNRLLENIFFKNSPLHDGAVIISKTQICAARCVLPSSDNTQLPANYGMRHRAALGVSENSDALVVIVSEETGKISFVEKGGIQSGISTLQLKKKLEQALN